MRRSVVRLLQNGDVSQFLVNADAGITPVSKFQRFIETFTEWLLGLIVGSQLRLSFDNLCPISRQCRGGHGPRAREIDIAAEDAGHFVCGCTTAN